MTANPIALRTLPFALAAAEQQPTSAAAWFSAGRALLAVGQTREAVDALQRAVALDPAHGPAWRELGVVVAGLGWSSEPITCFRNAVAALPNDTDARVLLAQALLNAGDTSGAEAAARVVLAKRPDHPDGVATLVRVHLRRGALSVAQSLVADAPPAAAVALARAEVAVAAGEPEQAVAPLRAAIAGASGLDRVRLLHALGESLDASGAHDEAFAAFHEANEGRSAPVDPSAVLADAEARVDEPPGTLAGPPLRRMLWIVGLPRSGAGVVEQILTTHPRIVAGGERSPLPQLEAAHARGAPLTELSLALRASLEGVAPTATYVTDKLPDNTRRLGLAAQIAPGSTVICIDRDPLDTLWSCYRQCYGDGLAWTTRFEGLAAAWHAHRKLIEHWRAALPQMGAAWIDLRYETLVSRPESEIRRLLLALNLPLDPACFGPVGIGANRQRLHRQRVGRSGPYRAHLAPLVDALQ